MNAPNSGGYTNYSRTVRIGMASAKRRFMNKTFNDLKEWTLVWGSFALFAAFEIALIYGFLKLTGTV
jgi:hypothetical protein